MSLSYYRVIILCETMWYLYYIHICTNKFVFISISYWFILNSLYLYWYFVHIIYRYLFNPYYNPMSFYTHFTDKKTEVQIRNLHNLNLTVKNGTGFASYSPLKIVVLTVTLYCLPSGILWFCEQPYPWFFMILAESYKIKCLQR